MALSSMVMRTMLDALGSPFFWLVVLLVALQYRGRARARGRLPGNPTEPFWVPVLYSTIAGIAGGIAGSVLMVLLGVSVSNIGIVYLWLLAILLLLVNPRFLCFSYSGGLLSLCSLAFGFPRLDVPQLMALVGTLHLIESFLIMVSGNLGAFPVYLRLPRGRVVGALSLQCFWPIPLVAGAIIWGAAPLGVEMEMPAWWPLIRPAGMPGLDQAIYVILPLVAALGYGDLAVTALPAARSSRTAFTLLLYSVILLALAGAASYYPFLAIVAAVFAPVGHEISIILGRRAELRGEPFFVPPPQGVMLLDTVRGSPSWRWGLRSGSILQTINGQPVDCREEASAALEAAGPFIDIEYLSPSGNRQQLRRNYQDGIRHGMIFVPEPGDEATAELRSGFFDGLWLHRLFRK